MALFGRIVFREVFLLRFTGLRLRFRAGKAVFADINHFFATGSNFLAEFRRCIRQLNILTISATFLFVGYIKV